MSNTSSFHRESKYLIKSLYITICHSYVGEKQLRPVKLLNIKVCKWIVYSKQLQRVEKVMLSGQERGVSSSW